MRCAVIRARRWSLLLCAITLLGCADAASRGAAPSSSSGPAETSSAAPRTLVIGTLGAPRVFGHQDYPTGGVASLTEIHSTGLVTWGREGGLTPRLATAIPSLDDGSM